MAVAGFLCHFNLLLIAVRLKLLSYTQSSFILLNKTVFIGMFFFLFLLICKSLSGIYVVPISLLYWVGFFFFFVFFPSPISRLDNPSDLKISL